MKVKVFIYQSPERMEDEINEWIAREGVCVRHVTQSQGEKQGRFLLVVTVFFDSAA